MISLRIDSRRPPGQFGILGGQRARSFPCRLAPGHGAGRVGGRYALDPTVWSPTQAVVPAASVSFRVAASRGSVRLPGWWVRQRETVMAFIRYVDDTELPQADRVLDTDNILQIHGVHPAVMHQHYELYLEVIPSRRSRANSGRCWPHTGVSAEWLSLLTAPSRSGSPSHFTGSRCVTRGSATPARRADGRPVRRHVVDRSRSGARRLCRPADFDAGRDRGERRGAPFAPPASTTARSTMRAPSSPTSRSSIGSPTALGWRSKDRQDHD